MPRRAAGMETTWARWPLPRQKAGFAGAKPSRKIWKEVQAQVQSLEKKSGCRHQCTSRNRSLIDNEMRQMHNNKVILNYMIEKKSIFLHGQFTQWQNTSRQLVNSFLTTLYSRGTPETSSASSRCKVSLGSLHHMPIHVWARNRPRPWGIKLQTPLS